jgi:hypothetical protein
MATLTVLQGALTRATAGVPPRDMIELGAGDGSLMLRLAREHVPPWPAVRVTLLDRLHLVAPATLEGLRHAGWTPSVTATDVFDWLARADDVRWDVVFANLFMHHFSAGELQRLLAGVAARTTAFVCVEPRRAILPLAGSHLVGLLGAGPVTRQDAVASVHAGFRGRELSELWPDHGRWALQEYSAGLFSHCFVAVRRVP